MKLSSFLQQPNLPPSRELEVIKTMSIKENRLVENYFKDFTTQQKVNWFVNNKKGEPILIDESNYEWLSPTFIRIQNDLFGFSLIEKSNSVKLFLTKVKEDVDFDTFQPLNRFYAKDKHRYYYGPGGKTIKEDNLKPLFNDEYQQAWNKLYPERATPLNFELWNTKNAISPNHMYWHGMLKKELHTSLRRISQFFWVDDYSVYYYDLQRLKKLEDFDRSTLLFKTEVREGRLKSFITDINKSAHCYINNSEPNPKYDYNEYAPFFEELRGSISENYWWYKMEKAKA